MNASMQHERGVTEMNVAAHSLEHLLIKDACAELVMKSASFVDNGEYSRLEEVFDAQASLRRPNGDVLVGFPAIVAAYRNRPPERMTRHIVASTMVEVTSETEALGSSSVLLWSGNHEDYPGPAGTRAAARQTLGRFDDHFVRTSTGWRIIKRIARFELFYEPEQASLPGSRQ